MLLILLSQNTNLGSQFSTDQLIYVVAKIIKRPLCCLTMAWITIAEIGEWVKEFCNSVYYAMDKKKDN